MDCLNHAHFKPFLFLSTRYKLFYIYAIDCGKICIYANYLFTCTPGFVLWDYWVTS